MQTTIFDAVRDADSAEVARALGLEFPRGGKRAVCPFCGHAPATMSFTRNLWHCFRCGEAGDSIKLVQRIQGCGALDAARYVNEVCACGWSDSGGISPEMQARINARKQQQSHAQYVEAARKYALDAVIWAERYLESNAPSSPEEMTDEYLEVLGMRHVLDAIWQEASAREYEPKESKYIDEVKRLGELRTDKPIESGDNRASDKKRDTVSGYLDAEGHRCVYIVTRRRSKKPGKVRIKSRHS